MHKLCILFEKLINKIVNQVVNSSLVWFRANFRKGLDCRLFKGVEDTFPLFVDVPRQFEVEKSFLHFLRNNGAIYKILPTAHYAWSNCFLNNHWELSKFLKQICSIGSSSFAHKHYPYMEVEKVDLILPWSWDWQIYEKLFKGYTWHYIKEL